MSAPPTTRTTYAGATLDLTNLFSATTVAAPGLDASCALTTAYEVRSPEGIWANSAEPFYGRVISSTTPPTGTGVASRIII